MTDRSFGACRALSHDELHREFPIGLGSVHATLLHLYGAERIWIGVLEGDAAISMATPQEFPDIAGIRAGFSAARARWDAYLARLDAAECARVVVRVRDGKEFRQLAGDALMQVPTHALYHNAQVSFMMEAAKEMGNMKSTLDRMVNHWAAGDPDALAAVMNEGMSDPAVAEALLYSRNANWAEWIDTRLDKPGSVFIAVGAGHLAGAKSVQDYLAQKGITVTRVK